MIIMTNTDDRKALVRVISEFTEEEQSYLGPPSFAYRVGEFIIDRDSAISCEDEEEGEKLKDHLKELGLIEQQLDSLEISVPIEGMDGFSLRNLIFMLHSKQHLLNRVVGSNNFIVNEDIIKTLELSVPKTKEEFLELYKSEKIQGIAFDNEKVTFHFPLSDKPDKNRAYAEVVALMVAQAKKVKRVNPIEQKPENEKYYLRTWLVRLGLSGEAGKASRKALLDGLKGHTAFRTPADEEKHKARLLAKKECEKDSAEEEV